MLCGTKTQFSPRIWRIYPLKAIVKKRFIEGNQQYNVTNHNSKKGSLTVCNSMKVTFIMKRHI